MLSQFTATEAYPDTRHNGKDWHPALASKKYRRYVPLALSLAAALFPQEADQIAWARRALAVDDGVYFHPTYLVGNSRTNPGFGARVLQELSGGQYNPLVAIMK